MFSGIVDCTTFFFQAMDFDLGLNGQVTYSLQTSRYCSYICSFLFIFNALSAQPFVCSHSYAPKESPVLMLCGYTLFLFSCSPAFSIDGTTGAVSVKNPREVPSQAVQLVVVATDKGQPPLQSTSYIHVSIYNYCLYRKHHSTFCASTFHNERPFVCS